MENKRFALNIGINLSGQLINASLSMLAIIGALFIFIIDKREITSTFYILISINFLSFIASIILGGKGINEVRKKSFKDKLKLRYSINFFNLQAIFCIVGIFACISSFIFTKKIKENNSELIELNNNLQKIMESNGKDTLSIEEMKNKIEKLTKRVDSIELIQHKTVPNNGSSPIDGSVERK